MFGCQDNQETRVFQKGEGGKKCYMLPHQFVCLLPPQSYCSEFPEGLLKVAGINHSE